MGDFITGLASFLRINARTAFALFAAGLMLWHLRKAGYVANDPVEIAIGYLATFGLFVFMGIYLGKILRWLRRKRHQGAQRLATERSELLEAERAKQFALENLFQLEGAETQALAWIYHRDLRRVRASQNYYEIQNLERMKILTVEDRKLPYHDRIFIVPKYIDDALAKVFGARNINKTSSTPPWLSRR